MAQLLFGASFPQEIVLSGVAPWPSSVSTVAPTAKAAPSAAGPSNSRGDGSLSSQSADRGVKLFKVMLFVT